MSFFGLFGSTNFGYLRNGYSGLRHAKVIYAEERAYDTSLRSLSWATKHVWLAYPTYHTGNSFSLNVIIWVWVKIRYPNNWMVNTKLDIHICGPLGLPFWPTSISQKETQDAHFVMTPQFPHHHFWRDVAERSCSFTCPDFLVETKKELYPIVSHYPLENPRKTLGKP